MLGVIKAATSIWLRYEIPQKEMKENKEEMDFVSHQIRTGEQGTE